MKKLTLILSLLIALVGLNANATMYIVGTDPFGGWVPEDGVEMTESSPGVYTLNATLVQNDIWFIFAEAVGSWDVVNEVRYDSGDWNSDLTVYADVEFTPVKGNTGKSFAFSGTAGEAYTFTFDKNTGKAMISGYVAPINPVTGDLFLLGQVNGNNWNPSAGIEMATADENIYTLTGAEVINSGDGYGYFSFTSKLGENENDWSFTAYRRGAQADGTLVESGVAAVLAGWGTTNAFKVQPGTYDFEVNLSENTVTVTLTGEAPEDYYIVAGTQNLFGSNWNITDEANLMTEGEDGIFTLTKEGFEATAGTEVMFKVVANGSWDTCWPESDENGDNNWYYKFEEDGVYTVVITFNEETKEITCVATRTGDLPDVPPTIDNVYIIGDVNEIGWSATSGVQMTYDETNKVYTAEITTQNQGDLGTAYFGFTKMLAEEDTDGAWDVIAPYRFGPVSNGAFVMTDQLLGQSIELDLNGSYESVAIPAGTWTVTVDLVNAILKIEGEWPYYDGDVYILGEVDGNSWAPNVGVLMRKSGRNYLASVHTDGTPDGYSYFSFSKTLATNEGNDGWAEIAGSRFGAVTDGNPFTVTDEMLDQTLDLVMAADPMSFQIPAGDWILNVDVDRMTLVISDARGDVNLDAAVNIQDVTALINYLLSKNANGISLGNANCNKDQAINISDVTTLINFLLSKQWPAE